MNLVPTTTVAIPTVAAAEAAEANQEAATPTGLHANPTAVATPMVEEPPVEEEAAGTRTEADPPAAGDGTHSEAHQPGTRTVVTRGAIMREAETPTLVPGATMMMALHPGDTETTSHPDTREEEVVVAAAAAAAAMTAMEVHPETGTTKVHDQGAHLDPWAQETTVRGGPHGDPLGTTAP